MLNKIVVIVSLLFLIIKDFEVPGNGEAKKEIVLNLVGAIYDAVNGMIAIPWDKAKMLDFVGRSIDAIVAFLNVVGFFTHSTTT
jgi:hypothetical protein